MKVGLIDVDGHNFPNLALMKLSAYYKAQGADVEMLCGLEHYDVVFVSKVFTFTPDYQQVIYADEIYYGGTGYTKLNDTLPHDVESMCPDYSLYPKFKEAYGFLSRGCPNNCPFCIVSKKEGFKSHQVADLSDFYRGQKVVRLLDPNLLASDNHMQLLQQLIDCKAKVNFTQGLDPRLINADNVRLLAKIRVDMVHFAFDLMCNESRIVEGLKLYKQATGVYRRKASVYILTNFNTTHEEDLYRCEVVKELGYNPYIMIYDKENAPQETRHLQRWANNKWVYEGSGRDFSRYACSR